MFKWSPRIFKTDFGCKLEYVKEKIEEMFIEKNVVLIDKDTKKKHRIRYLIGTQVVNRILDDDIGLVAIILSDIFGRIKKATTQMENSIPNYIINDKFIL